MIELLQNFSIQQILFFIVLLALAIRGCVSFIDWISGRTKQAVHKADEPEQLRKDIESQSKEINELKTLINTLTDKVNMLINSDKDSIKAYITKEHHEFVYNKGWIDDYSLNCIEQRYTHYTDEGGNSFIANLMDELRKLPKELPRG